MLVGVEREAKEEEEEEEGETSKWSSCFVSFSSVPLKKIPFPQCTPLHSSESASVSGISKLARLTARSPFG